MDNDITFLVFQYVDSAFASLGKQAPRKEEDKIDIVKALEILAHYEWRGEIMPFPVWLETVKGRKPEKEIKPPEWPANLQWPPLFDEKWDEELDKIAQATYG